MGRNKWVYPDLYHVTPERASILMMHHLFLAATYFEAAPESLGDCIKRMEKEIETYQDFFMQPIIEKACKAFLESLHYDYQQMGKK